MAEKDPKLLGFGGPDGPKRPDGSTFRYTPFALVSEKNDSNRITRDFFDSLVLEYRFVDAVIPDMTTEFLGEAFDTPILCGGMSAAATRLRPEGMLAVAEGIKPMNTPMFTGYLHDDEFEAICATGVRAIRIIKAQRDNDAILRDIAHDEACGAFAWAMDIDHAFGGNGFYSPGGGRDFGELGPKTLEELKMLIGSSDLPCVIKGVLSVQDAVKCVEAGAAAILVSHHKGELPCAVPPAYVLPEIRKAVGGKIKILADCGVTSGMDAYKLLALGADGVCICRALIPGLMKDGAAGVTASFTRINDELRACMARTCTPDTHSFDPGTVRSLYRGF